MDSTLHSLTTRCPVCLQRLPLLAVGRPSRLGLQWRRYRAAVAGLAAIAAPVYGYAARVTGWPRVGLVAVLVVGAVAAAAWAEEKSG